MNTISFSGTSRRGASDGADGKVRGPRDATAGYVNNQRETFGFQFDGVLRPDAGKSGDSHTDAECGTCDASGLSLSDCFDIQTG